MFAFVYTFETRMKTVHCNILVNPTNPLSTQPLIPLPLEDVSLRQTNCQIVSVAAASTTVSFFSKVENGHLTSNRPNDGLDE